MTVGSLVLLFFVTTSWWCPSVNSFKFQLCNHTSPGTHKLWFPGSCLPSQKIKHRQIASWHRLWLELVATGGVYKGQGRNRCKLMTCTYWEFLVHGE